MLDKVGEWVRENNHWIGLAGVLIGALLSIYFYWAAKPVGEISLSFKTVKIAQAGVPILRILDDKGEPIAADVYGLEVVAWNSGEVSLGLSTDRIRRPLTITLPSASRVLGAVVQDVRNISIPDVRTSVDGEQKSVAIAWQQFDPSDALKVFIIYVSQTQSPIDFSSRIIGAHLLSVSEYKETAPAASGFTKFWDGSLYDWENHKLKFILSIVATGLQLLAFVVIIVTRRSRKGKIAIPILMVASICAMGLASTPVLFARVPF